MDRENNDRSMIDRTVGEKKELHFPAVHLPVMAWASLVCLACFAIYLPCPPLHAHGHAAHNVRSTTAQSRKRVACGVWTRKNRAIYEKRVAAPSEFWTSKLWTRKCNLYFADAVSPTDSTTGRMPMLLVTAASRARPSACAGASDLDGLESLVEDLGGDPPQRLVLDFVADQQVAAGIGQDRRQG